MLFISVSDTLRTTNGTWYIS